MSWKLMLSVFWDMKRIVNQEFVARHTTINSDQYCVTMEYLKRCEYELGQLAPSFCRNMITYNHTQVWRLAHVSEPSRHSWLVPYFSQTFQWVCLLFSSQFLILDLNLLKDSDCTRFWNVNSSPIQPGRRTQWFFCSDIWRKRGRELDLWIQAKDALCVAK